jgi:toxin ParE1/3/4
MLLRGRQEAKSTAEQGVVSGTPCGAEDLVGIWGHIASSSPGAADRAYDRIEDNCLLLKDYPQLGAARSWIADTARVLVIDRWLYWLRDGQVQVVRIVDASRDLTNIE